MKNIHGRINRRANQVNYLIVMFSCGYGDKITQRQKRLSTFAYSFDCIDEEPMYEDLKMYHYGSNNKFLYN